MLFFTKRERKTHYISLLINCIIFTILGIYIFSPKSIINFIVVFFFLVFVIQLFTVFMPLFLEHYILNAQHPKEKTRELEKKITMIKEEIKKVNGEDYNEDIFFDD